jgi:predicted dinucleotide-binding enzyme
MKIAVIGTGSVGGTLGRRWAELGHSVCFGVRDLADTAPKRLVSKIKGDARFASVRDATKDADVVVLATPYAANAAPITSAGDLPGKILIDVTNPIGADFTLAWSLPAQAPKKQQNWHRARGFKRECIKWVSRSWPTLPSRLGSP